MFQSICWVSCHKYLYYLSNFAEHCGFSSLAWKVLSVLSSYTLKLKKLIFLTFVVTKRNQSIKKKQKCGLNLQFIRGVTFRCMPARIEWSCRLLWCLCLFREPLKQKDENKKQPHTITPPLSYLTADFNNCGAILSSVWQGIKNLHDQANISYFD